MKLGIHRHAQDTACLSLFGMNAHSHKHTPTHTHTQRKEKSVEIKNAVVELDYTSQINKDLEKRRKYLFRVMLPSSVEYIFQAPSDTLRSKWYGMIM